MPLNRRLYSRKLQLLCRTGKLFSTIQCVPSTVLVARVPYGKCDSALKSSKHIVKLLENIHILPFMSDAADSDTALRRPRTSCQRCRDKKLKCDRKFACNQCKKWAISMRTTDATLFCTFQNISARFTPLPPVPL